MCDPDPPAPLGLLIRLGWGVTVAALPRVKFLTRHEMEGRKESHKQASMLASRKRVHPFVFFGMIPTLRWAVCHSRACV